MRVDGRKNNQLRPLKIERGYIKYPEGSVLITTGSTVVLCNATVEEGVPSFLRGSGKGWITAEYSLLPRSTNTRNAREAARGKQSGRTQEIQRLIGRSLRSVVDLSLLGERQVVLDCDVLQADGGTRTASITGAFVALVDALAKVCVNKGGLFPVRDFLCAVSVGLVEEQALLDLCYEEDRGADVDMNIVMTGCGDFVELQGTGEEYHFSRDQLDKLLALGERGCKELVNRQKKALGKLAGKVGGTI